MAHLLDRVRKEIDLAASTRTEIDALRTVCLMVGPYRNLTTLIASTYSLHPGCQVLNHAGERILRDTRLNFIAGYADDRFTRFLRYAIRISGAGRRGRHGGSIHHSHGYGGDHAVVARYAARFGPRRIKSNIESLLWKESLLISDELMKCEGGGEALFARHEMIRFVMPVRHPLDCAQSNLRTGHARYLRAFDPAAPLRSTLTGILQQIAWVNGIARRSPGRVLMLMEYDFGPRLIGEMEAFARLTPDCRWHRDAAAVLTSKSRHQHDAGARDLYRRLVDDTCADDPELAGRLLAFGA